MSFYESIAPWYNYIFPLSLKKVEFVKNLSLKECPKVTETGCATGEFALALKQKGCKVFGFDLDEEMIKASLIAVSDLTKNESTNTLAGSESKIDFRVLNMLELDKEPLAQDNDIVCCFGNTLVHLQNLAQIEEYIGAVYNTLLPQGIFTGQIVNYDRIISHKAKGLPTIDNSKICFKREYSCVNNTDYDNSVDCSDGILSINFTTRLFVKAENKTIENNIVLLALKKEILQSVLQKAGFEDVTFYGNYNKDEWTLESGPTIFVAQK